MKWCLCKECDYVDISTYGAGMKYVVLCICCGGQRYEHWETCE